jgi:hypothetical protein
MKQRINIPARIDTRKHAGFAILLVLAATVGAGAQQLKLGNNSTRFDSSAALEIESQKLALLLPRINDTGTIVKTVKNGSLIYFTNLPAAGANKGLYVRSNNKWNFLPPTAGAAWGLTGNSGTSSGSHFLGTTDNHPLLFKTNNLTRLFIDSTTGNTGFRTSTPRATLHNQGSTLFGVKALANFAASGAIGTALATVDSFTVFSIPQTTTGRTLSLPAPAQTTAGRIAVLLNTGTASFTLGSSTVTTGSAITCVWSGASWLVTGDGTSTLTFTPPYTYKPLGSLGMMENAGIALTTGIHNIALGLNALSSNTTGNRKIAIGTNASANDVTSSWSIAIGTNTLNNTVGSSNSAIAIGYNTLSNNAAGESMGIGHSALQLSTSGYYNTAIGVGNLAALTTGEANTAAGGAAMQLAEGTVYDNTTLGFQAGWRLTGFRNTAIGSGTLDSATGSTNTAIGAEAASLSTRSMSTAIGAGVVISNSNTIIMGTTATNVGVGTYTPAYRLQVNGRLAGNTAYSTISDGRLKETVQPVQQALDNIKALRSITFHWNQEAAGRFGLNTDSLRHYGFIAQEVEKILPQVVLTDTSPFQVKSIAYADIIPVLTEAMKQQQAQMEHLQKEKETARQRIKLLQQQLNSIQKQIHARL